MGLWRHHPDPGKRPGLKSSADGLKSASFRVGDRGRLEPLTGDKVDSMERFQSCQRAIPIPYRTHSLTLVFLLLFGGVTKSGGGYPSIVVQADSFTVRWRVRHEGSEGEGHAVSFRNRFISRNVGR